MLTLPTAADALRFINFYHVNSKDARCYVIDVLVKIAKKLYDYQRHQRIDCTDRLRICTPDTMAYSETYRGRSQIIHVCPAGFDSGLLTHAETAGVLDMALILFTKAAALPMQVGRPRNGNRLRSILNEDVNGLPMAALLPWEVASRNAETYAYFIQCKAPLLFLMLQSITNILLGAHLLPNYPPV